MTHAMVIAVFVVLFAADGLAAGEGSPVASWHPVGVVMAAAAGFAAIAALSHLRIAWCGRRLERTGDPGWVGRAERAAGLARLGAVAWHGVAVLWLGELGAAREMFGPVPAAGDALAIALALGVFVSTLASFFGVERRLREALALRDAELGLPVRSIPTRGAFVWAGFRQQVLFVALPLGCIYTWGLFVAWAWGRYTLPWPGALDAFVQLGGAVVVFVLIPPAMRRVLNAVRLPDGAMRDRLVELGRAHGVRFRDVLVWRTGGTQVNGAVMGLVAPVRYVLLTDALLAQLSEREVEAVMAHEVAHVRRHHILWLGIAVIGTVSAVGTPMGWFAMGVGRLLGVGMLAEGVALVVTLGAALLTLGFVSRRFEWQADAFAAKHLSGWRGRGPVRVEPDAAKTMASALDRVARLNGIDPGRFGWRHGSIRTRITKLRRLIGRPADRLPVDREAGLVKLAALGLLVAGGALVAIQLAVEFWILSPRGWATPGG